MWVLGSSFNSGASVYRICWTLHQRMVVEALMRVQGWLGWQMKKKSGWVSSCVDCGQNSIQVQVVAYFVGRCARNSGNTNEGARSKEMTNEKRNCIVEYIYGFGWYLNSGTRVCIICWALRQELVVGTLMEAQGWQRWQMRKVVEWLSRCVNLGDIWIQMQVSE